MSTAHKPLHRAAAPVIPAHPLNLTGALTDVLPTSEDTVTAEPPVLAAVDAQTVQRLHRTAGPGPHLAQLTDTEHAALLEHLARLDAAIARHRTGEPADDDWPFYVDTMAESLDAYLYRGSTPDRGDDPSEYDWEALSEHAADLLEGVKAEWIERAEAYSARRPLRRD